MVEKKCVFELVILYAWIGLVFVLVQFVASHGAVFSPFAAIVILSCLLWMMDGVPPLRQSNSKHEQAVRQDSARPQSNPVGGG